MAYIVVGTKAEAETVISEMTQILEKFKVALVADLKNLVGIPPVHIDSTFGWDNVESFTIVETPGGFEIQHDKSKLLTQAQETNEGTDIRNFSTKNLVRELNRRIVGD